MKALVKQFLLVRGLRVVLLFSEVDDCLVGGLLCRERGNCLLQTHFVVERAGLDDGELRADFYLRQTRLGRAAAWRLLRNFSDV